ncbi:hypothetical protein [Nannocystis sp.]|uniref:hypothetical protein n=1 Tax=Nannocystis sp. TaxID=1962667 RepID=UPI0025E36687|nr:hypothetical protein [Nannocystis sp.]MBK7828386.1 hypothetical protein [Nannocystis sp.]
MPDNRDIAVLAKKIYELSTLAPAELDERKWEALLILTAVLSSATADGIARTNADKELRWGDAIRKEGLLSALHPKWHLRSDDGKPPVIQLALESALDNPHRDLRTRLQALQFIAPADREPLIDLARSLVADAFKAATGDARNQYVDTMRSRSATWFREPWLIVLPYEGQPPGVLILIDNQGSTHDGGIYDDPSDDTEWEKTKFGWADAIRTWDVDFLRDNPLAQFYLGAQSTAGDIASGANDAVKGIATLLKWAPYAAAGIAVIGLTATVLVTRR